jgi:hypothetical protein
MSVRSIFVSVVFLAAAAAATAEPRQGPILVSFADGHVTVVATDASAADILAEWGQVGKTEMIGLDKLSGRHLTLTLKGVDESAALEAILGSGSGFAASIKTVPDGTVSRFMRLVVGASTAPARDDRTRQPPDPESIYDYSQPSKAGPPAADGDLAAGLAATRDLPAGTPVSEPERTYEYFTPVRVTEALSRPQPVVIPRDPAAPAPVFVDPETRFQYYVPGKAAPKPPAPAKKGGETGTTPR